jgi:cytochrome c553
VEYLNMSKMKKLCVLLTALGAGTVMAEPSSTVVWDSATRHLVGNGDPVKGKEVADPCSACHGESGKAKVRPNFPLLAGQTAPYIYKQMMDYKEARRGHGIMQNFASSLSKQEIADVAEYVFEAFIRPQSAQAAPAAAPDKKKKKGKERRMMKR